MREKKMLKKRQKQIKKYEDQKKWEQFNDKKLTCNGKNREKQAKKCEKRQKLEKKKL